MKTSQTMNPEPKSASGIFMPFYPLDALAGERLDLPRALPGGSFLRAGQFSCGGMTGSLIKGSADGDDRATPKFFQGSEL